MVGRKELRDKRSDSGWEEWEQCESQRISVLVLTLLHTSYVNLGILPSSLSLSFFICEVEFISLTYRTVGIYVLTVKQLTHCLECNESLMISSYCYYFFDPRPYHSFIQDLLIQEMSENMKCSRLWYTKSVKNAE